jgi:hypothetical protein
MVTAACETTGCDMNGYVITFPEDLLNPGEPLVCSHCFQPVYWSSPQDAGAATPKDAPTPQDKPRKTAKKTAAPRKTAAKKATARKGSDG